jgi:hypothetical protein
MANLFTVRLNDPTQGHITCVIWRNRPLGPPAALTRGNNSFHHSTGSSWHKRILGAWRINVRSVTAGLPIADGKHVGPIPTCVLRLRAPTHLPRQRAESHPFADELDSKQHTKQPDCCRVEVGQKIEGQQDSNYAAG